jgi:formate C-acetyltransferase
LVFGHVSYTFERVLRIGLDGIKDICFFNLKRTEDPVSIEFYDGVITMIDAVLEWNDRHAAVLEKMGKPELAAIVRKVPRKPAETFREAVQAVNMIYFAVSRETSAGTYGPGWLDYYLWPYLKRDIDAGICTMEEASELLAELFIHIDERIMVREAHNDTVIVGGSHPNGLPAVNPLSYLIVEIIMELSITCLLVYIKMPENPPDDFVKLASRYLMYGKNRGMVISDQAMAGALEKRGMPYNEALGYTVNGCMEVTGPANNSDLLFSGWHNMPKYVELAITKNRCLVSGNVLEHVHFKGLSAFQTFDAFYSDFISEVKRILHIYFNALDMMSEYADIYRPAYFASSLINDCLLRGRNMHGGGAKYHDYGTAPVGLANAADALYAIKKAVFDDSICTSEELLTAIEADFKGYEKLRLMLRAIPKFGQDQEEADQFTVQFVNDICDIFDSYTNRLGGRVKLVIMTFIWANVAGAHLGATADGNRAKTAIAQGVTPQSNSMSEGVTAAIKSNTKLPYDRMAGGASTMWDFDESWLTQDILENLIMTFVDLGGQMFQGNTSVDVHELMKAKADPQSYPNLIVRVGGFSARFVDLTPDLQDDIIKRHRHMS